MRIADRRRHAPYFFDVLAIVDRESVHAAPSAHAGKPRQQGDRVARKRMERCWPEQTPQTVALV
jgi:hypothetical protein